MAVAVPECQQHIVHRLRGQLAVAGGLQGGAPQRAALGAGSHNARQPWADSARVCADQRQQQAPGRGRQVVAGQLAGADAAASR